MRVPATGLFWIEDADNVATVLLNVCGNTPVVLGAAIIGGGRHEARRWSRPEHCGVTVSGPA